MPRFFNPSDIVKPFSRYSHGAVVEGPARWLHISGQVGATARWNARAGFRSPGQAKLVQSAGGAEGRRDGAGRPGQGQRLPHPGQRRARIAPIPRRSTRGCRARLDHVGHLGSGAPDLLIEVDAIAARSL